MSEENSTSEESGADPIAISLGLSRAKADAFLEDQSHHLHEQFARAVALDLTPFEKSELARMNHA
jgi:hypothetical protein